MKIVWTDGAVEDLQQASDYLERSSAEAAARLVEAVLTRVGGLSSMSYRGRKRRSDDGYEVYLDPWSYVILYRILEDSVHIEGIMHTSRDREL